LEDRLAAVARMVAEDARQNGVGRAPMLAALERAWAGLAEVHGLPAREARALRDRLVTFGVRAYDAHRSTPPGTPGAGAGAPRVAGEDDRRGGARRERPRVSVGDPAAETGPGEAP
jgi:hypothetical protein